MEREKDTAYQFPEASIVEANECSDGCILHTWIIPHILVGNQCPIHTINLRRNEGARLLMTIQNLKKKGKHEL